MNNENTENSVDVDHQSLINILLQNPEDFNLKQKPSGIRENKMFTLDMREIPMSSAKMMTMEHIFPKAVLQCVTIVCVQCVYVPSIVFIKGIKSTSRLLLDTHSCGQRIPGNVATMKGPCE